jgi:co-chaperonin GroES (HSP10)
MSNITFLGPVVVVKMSTPPISTASGLVLPEDRYHRIAAVPAHVRFLGTAIPSICSELKVGMTVAVPNHLGTERVINNETLKVYSFEDLLGIYDSGAITQPARV